MSRTITIEVSCCKECPHLAHYGYGGINCGKLGCCISNENIIPTWCPLLKKKVMAKNSAINMEK